MSVAADPAAGRPPRAVAGRRTARLASGLPALALALPLAACSVGPTFVTPQASVEARWKDAGFPAVTTSRDESRRWWTTFRDPALNRLVDMAYAQNLTLMEAGARVIEARATLGQAVGELYPQTQQLSGTADYLQPSRTDATSNPNDAITSRQFWRVNLGGQGEKLLPQPVRIQAGAAGFVQQSEKVRHAEKLSPQEQLVAALGFFTLKPPSSALT